MARGFNLGNALVYVGLAGLVTTFFVPSWTARRVARVEGRAHQTAELLMSVALELDPTDPDEDRARILETLRAGAVARGHPDSDLPAMERRAGDTATFGTRHYLFRLARRPGPPTADPEELEPAPLDVYAWPRSTLPPGRSVFYLSSDGRSSFTRNLVAGYSGLDEAPPPRAGLPHGDKPEETDYRSADDERWIVLAAPENG